MRKSDDRLRSLSVTVSGLAASLLLWSPIAPSFSDGVATASVQDTKPATVHHGAPQPRRSELPNVAIILIDDMGFGDLSTFGGPVESPELDRLAATGLRYNNFNTAVMCAPTRAALLTGRNSHHAGFGGLPEFTVPAAGYDGILKPSTATIARVLKLNGYSTAAVGKWHNTPSQEISPGGPFDRWPTGVGFDYFYGFMGWETGQFEPELYDGTTRQPMPTSRNYHLTADLADHAIGWIRTHRAIHPIRPYFLYFATGATHAPNQVDPAWIEKYKGRFDQGWDKLREQTFARQKKLGVIPFDTILTPRPSSIPAWNSLSADQHRLLARQMEVYAAYAAETDEEIGHLVRAIRDGPDGDNTLIFYIVGDNGAAGEGGLFGQMDHDINNQVTFAEQLAKIDELGSKLHNNIYSGAWAWAGNTPFRWFKGVAAYFGSTRNPMVVSWPARITDHGGLRSQFTDVNDLAPTIYAAAGFKMPAEIAGVRQIPLDGRSFLATFADARARSAHRTQYFEYVGSRAIYHDGWVAAALHGVPWAREAHDGDFAHDRWALYNVVKDFSESTDLANRFPAKLREMQRLFDREARANFVLPLHPAAAFRDPVRPRNETFDFYSDMAPIPTKALGFDPSNGYRVNATVNVGAGPAEGVIFSYGSRYNGFVLYASRGSLFFESRFANKEQFRISAGRLASGARRIALAYQPAEKAADVRGATRGTLQISVDGRAVALRPISVNVRPYAGAASAGRIDSSSMAVNVMPPFRFNGIVKKVTLHGNS